MYSLEKYNTYSTHLLVVHTWGLGPLPMMSKGDWCSGGSPSGVWGHIVSRHWSGVYSIQRLITSFSWVALAHFSCTVLLGIHRLYVLLTWELILQWWWSLIVMIQSCSSAACFCLVIGQLADCQTLETAAGARNHKQPSCKYKTWDFITANSNSLLGPCKP